MHYNNHPFHVMLVIILLLLLLLPVSAGSTESTCLSCHGKNQQALVVPDADEKMRPLKIIQKDKFLSGVHGKMTCAECHREITDSNADHQKNPTNKPNCITCHQSLQATIKQPDPNSKYTRMDLVVQNIHAYKKSLHALPEGKSGVKAFCDDCHDTHYFNVPPAATAERTEWRLTIPSVCGTECHSDILEQYVTSVHGKEVLDHQNTKAAVCTDCHTTHDISKTTHDPFLLSVSKMCGSCHLDNFASYRDTYHGQINTLGYTYTAKCYNCHGSHKITGVDDPDSSIHIKNRLETCQQCHNGINIKLATQGFLTFSPHANTHDFERYPQVWIAAKFMHGLLLFVFSYFWVHSLLWWHREYKCRKAGEGRPRIRTDELLEKTTKQIHRFGIMWRIAHLLLALSVMTLILTGMSVFYAHTAWAPVVIDAFGGPQTSGLVHRISAAIMLTIFLLHIVGASINIYRKRKTFRWFGPDSLLPNWKDLKDTKDMFKWFFNKGPRPMFDRWTYWEKFDYWAVFWGVAAIGSSGIMLSFPDVTASIFPGWVFNVVMLIHGEEAFLAAVFLFTVHFFNNHFRPDKLPPPDVAMFTGTQSLEEFKRDHLLHYQRLVETGQLEKHLVDAPSRPMTIGSTILGLVLITCGLGLLIVVAIGFFDS